LKTFGIETVEELTLMEDPQLEGVNRGFAFIEFGTHKEALRAFRRLQQADAIFGTERSAKVAWAQPLNEPDEDTMSQVHSIVKTSIIFSKGILFLCYMLFHLLARIVVAFWLA
jgi:RNA recognition motif-containing protein